MRKLFKKKSLLITITLLIGLSLFISGCGAGSKNEQSLDSAPMEDINYGVAENKSFAGNEGIGLTYTSATDDIANQYDQMIIYRANFNIVVDDIYKASNEIDNIIKNNNGYLLNSNKNENEGRIYAYYEYKVPVEEFHNIYGQINELPIGKIRDQRTNNTDVTEEYIDLDSRLKAKRAYEARLLDFLDKAEKTEDLLKISNDLNRVQEEIEQILGRQQYLKHHSDFSTIVVELEQNKDQSAPNASLWDKAVDGFNNSIDFLKNFFSSLLIWGITFIPILIVIGLVFIVVWYFTKRRGQIKKNNDEDEDN